MTTPLLSVILTTWNRATLLPRAITSVRAQLWQHWELIIENDGSTDNTMQILDAAVKDDSRIRVYSHENMGPSRSRNEGLRHARGDIVTFLDSDDEYLPEHLLIRVNIFRREPTLMFIHGGMQLTGDPALFFVPDRDDPSRLISLSECAVGGTFFARRGVIEAVGGWRDGYGEDADLLKRIESKCTVLRCEAATYVYHRETVDSRCSLAGKSRQTN